MHWTNHLSYRLLGPTTVHLRHETYLLISLALLEYASVRDIRFTALVTLWLSRSLVLRWLLTARDNLTAVSERNIPFLGNKYCWRQQFNPIENTIDFITTFVLAGQTFDRPNPHVVAKFVGTNHTAADMLVANDLGTVLNNNIPSSRNSNRRGNSGHYNNSSHHNNSHYQRQSYIDACFDWCEGIFHKLKELSPSSFAVASSEAYWTTLAGSIGPSPQVLVPICTMIFLYFCRAYPLSEDGGGFVRYFATMYMDIAQVTRDVYNIAANRNMIYYHYGRHDTTAGPLVTNHALILETLSSRGSPAMGYSGEITIDNTKAFGMYQQIFAPGWTDLFYHIMVGGTLLGVYLYGRVLLPIPDLVAGSNVLSCYRLRDSMGKTKPSGLSAPHGSGSKSHRNSSNSYQRGGGGGGGGGTSAAAGGGGSDANFEQPWLEHYQSIITEDRLKLIFKIAFVRVVENVFLIAILPRTDFACRTTGQCPNKSGLLELAKVMFHAGITSPLRSDSESYQYDDFGKKPYSVGENPFRPDVPSAYMIGISVVVVTLSLLLAQAATLNRSHLGITGYLAGGWVDVDPNASTKTNNNTNTNNISNNNKSNNKKSSSSQPAEWVPRKRYKKGDTVSYERTVYRATTNSPEGQPYDLYLRATHNLFRNELGHPATSRVVAFVSTVQFGLISCLILMILAYQLLLGSGYYYGYAYGSEYQQQQQRENTTCLLWTLAANLVAVYGTVSVAVPNYSEFDRLAEDIMKDGQ